VEEYFPGAELALDDHGFIIARLDLPDDPWLFSFILGFGADVEILSPSSWRQKVEKIVADMKKLYGT
jgi:predicted DNA-binding transcriptional regulator YafY